MNFTSLIHRVRKNYPDKIAVVEGNKKLTYKSFWNKINKAAGFLKQAGVKKGDRVLIILPNNILLLAFHFGVMKIGAVSVMVKTEYKECEISKIVKNCRPNLFITHDKWLADNAKIAQELEFGVTFSTNQISLEEFPAVETVLPVKNCDIATINYTYFGGDYPKGAVLTHGNHIYAASGYSRFQGFNTEDVFLIILPIPHVYTLSGCINSAFITGGTIVILNRLLPKSIFSAIEEHKITIFSAVPAIFDYLVNFKKKDKYCLASLRLCVTGGDFMPEKVQKDFEKELNTILVQGYGLTESLPVICNPPDERNKHGTLGIPGRKDIKMKIVDDARKELPVNSIGEILIKSPTTMARYYNLPGETEKIIKNGWVHTGDLGKIDSDGFLYFYGLKKDIINIYGNNVAPLEVKRVLKSHPSIKNIRVYKEEKNGNHSSLAIQKVCVDISLKKGKSLTPKEVRNYCISRFASYKVPEKINIVPG